MNRSVSIAEECFHKLRNGVTSEASRNRRVACLHWICHKVEAAFIARSAEMPKRKSRKSVLLPRKKRKSSLLPPERTSSPEQPRPRGRPPKVVPAVQEAVETDDNGQSDDDEDTRLGVQGISRDDTATPEDSDGGVGEEVEEEVEDDNESAEDTTGPDTIPQFSAKTIYVRQDTVNKKWEPISNVAQRAVRQVFADAARPVIASQLGERAGRDAQANEGKSAEAQKTVKAIVAKLSKQLPKMRLPPQTSTDAFDYERLVRETALAEAQLAEQMTGISALRKALQKSHEAKNKAKEEAAELEEKVDKQEEALNARINGKLAKWLRLPSEEPEDNAKHIRLASRRNLDSEDVQSLTGKLADYVQRMKPDQAQNTPLESRIDRTLTSLEAVRRRRAAQALEAG